MKENMLLKGNQKLAQVLVEPGSFSIWQELKRNKILNNKTIYKR